MLTLRKPQKKGYDYEKINSHYFNPHAAFFRILRVWHTHNKLLAFLLTVSYSRLTLSSSEAQEEIHFNKSTLALNSLPPSSTALLLHLQRIQTATAGL